MEKNLNPHIILGATGARAAVLRRHPSAKPFRTRDVGILYGMTLPVYVILDKGGKELGRGIGTTDAWHNAASGILKA
jgi:hypothetical protein